MIKVQNNTATRVALPPFLRGLSQADLADLSWTDPALGVQGVSWWPEVNESPPLPDEFHRYGDETLTPDSERRVVIVVRDVVPFSDEDKTVILERTKERALQRINDGYTAELNAILRGYPDPETKTWDKQESEARAYQSDSSAATPLIDAIANARSMDKAELVHRVIAKADAWISLSGAATGKRQALEDAIANAGSLEVVEGISW
ncbi:hypothetical protein [Vreelandella maris]|uniref:Uncharacterized protein n=1 Tax=Vreelandella maris TaxID=2729617 RepID=A0A7Y6RFS3_9GAMM|nr:hypothetical protein [Halomonas maris]NVF16217.1 hypothetical protein [Halomonas maris]|tara:strand:+ start:13802 stop:14416 length:615 start_codon:yes stop_codon:yes gene_type:complete